MGAVNKFERGEVIIYRDMQGDLSPYKVLEVKPMDTYFIALIGEFGKPSSKKFDTTLKTVDGKIRLLKCWLQPKQDVEIIAAGVNGVVDVIGYRDGRIMFDIIGEDNMQYTYTYEQIGKALDIITPVEI